MPADEPRVQVAAWAGRAVNRVGEEASTAANKQQVAPRAGMPPGQLFVREFQIPLVIVVYGVTISRQNPLEPAGNL